MKTLVDIKYVPKIQRKAEECVEEQVEDLKNAQETSRHLEDGSLQPTIDQAQQTTPDLHQRYLVETITMTTVTERRIVREISEEETQPLDEIDSNNEKDGSKLEFTICPPPDAKDILSDDVNNKSLETMAKIDKRNSKEISEASDLSLSFKLSTSLATNSLKPNSAVRQLFPDPRFISPPPAPTKNISLSDVDDEDEHSEAQKFLITTESLRLFDAVKRTKIAGNRSDSSESESSSIKRTIERNALRRSLISKYESGSKKKNLRSKDLTLEERIRQLTCVDQDEDTGDSNSSESGRTVEGCDQNNELPARTSPSGEERPKNDRVPRTLILDQELNHTPSYQNANHHHHQQSTYKKITDLFGQKKTVEMNLPDIGLGNRISMGKEYISKSTISKMNSDARKQFLASLAPLSCVASTGEGKDDYYRISSKITGSNRDSVGYNSDSSYSLEDIEAALRGEERNYRNAGPPDVTRGTPTSIGPDSGDASDELMAFVEQDKTRTERIKRRYNDVDERHEGTSVDGDVKENGKDKKGCVDDDEDDELNDYGFNRRPAVRGIKPQFGTTEEIVQQLRTRSVAATSHPDRTSLPPHWTFYDNSTDNNGEKQESFVDDASSETYKTVFNGENSGNHTINRINNMQRQIDDIYQTIADTSVNVQALERSYVDGNTLPRTMVHVAVGDNHRYVDQKNGVHFQDQMSGHRMVRVAGADVVPNSGYNSLPSKSRRHPVGFTNYSCSAAVPTSNPKCYRTMYLVPYNGITDPAYQNLQRILPAHSTPTNYANHIDRYPYPRNRIDQQQQQQLQQQPRYYVRPNNPPTSNLSGLHSQPQLHLHLHQSDEIHVASPPVALNHTVQTIHHQHHQVASYSGQPVPSYTVIAPPRPTAPYSHQVHLSRSASDVQTQTVSVPTAVGVIGGGGGGSTLTTFTGSTQILGTMTSSTILASPTKLQQHQRNNPCTVAERGVPEGAASAPAQDFNQTSSTNSSHAVTNSFIGHPNNVPPPNTQNSVYYAMNV
ncbi:uncharacterized protein LOC122499505 isoform X2 [Leptopilina heterotoma]|uniref:uncharacterized protein LOC122499505 isoform X2 n=1 Tax=Leptopilina heterotoma TaxID=63436 RepID=UPI001CA7BF88|nr:uncharacterized protein LOC122499505 isoform X2 [Leptopilina heterotoma]